MQSSYPYVLPGVSVMCRNFAEICSIPWKLEVPGADPKLGAIMLRMDSEPIKNMTAKVVGPDQDLGEWESARRLFMPR